MRPRQLGVAGAGLVAVPALDAALRGVIALLEDSAVRDAPPTLVTQLTAVLARLPGLRRVV